MVDSSGAVFLPAGRREDVLELARRRKAEEWDLRRAVTDGADPKTVFSPLPDRRSGGRRRRTARHRAHGR